MIIRKESQDNLREKQTTVQIAQKAGSPQKHLKYLPYRLKALCNIISDGYFSTKLE